MNVVSLNRDKIEEVADVLCESFYNYPVMKYVLGGKEDYNQRISKLITFFVSARAFRKEPMLGIYNSDHKYIAAAIITLPGGVPHPKELLELRKKLWSEIGSEEETRYSNYGDSASRLLPKEPHHHLNMIGVRNAYQGKGLARQLINTVEELVAVHPLSTGLSLNTEVKSNVDFYLHLGFDLVGQTKVDEGIDTWGFFKPKEKI